MSHARASQSLIKLLNENRGLFEQVIALSRDLDH